jgi:hypothetical protein
MDSGKPSGILSWQTTENELRLLEIEADELSFCARKSATLVSHVDRSANHAVERPSTSVDKYPTLDLHQEWG